ncbi:hypothetical protein HUT19_02760 [Streptomyces sp. NA02950]|nr:hypothetical protein HUT19_02760 [Streptomyces sp. NA02950]
MASRAAVRAPRHRQRDDAAGPERNLLGRPVRAYLAFLVLRLVNPWAVICFSALVPAGGAGTGAGPSVPAVFVAAVITASVSRQLLLAAGGAHWAGR